MRARPKILLAVNYEEALALYERYQPYVFGVMSDSRLPKSNNWMITRLFPAYPNQRRDPGSSPAAHELGIRQPGKGGKDPGGIS